MSQLHFSHLGLNLIKRLAINLNSINLLNQVIVLEAFNDVECTIAEQLLIDQVGCQSLFTIKMLRVVPNQVVSFTLQEEIVHAFQFSHNVILLLYGVGEQANFRSVLRQTC